MKPQLKVCDLTMALARMAGDVALLQQMVVFFREDAPEYLARLKSAVAVGDAAGVQHAAHSLRGMLAMFTAESAMHVALQLEQMGITGELGPAPVQTVKLEDEVSRMLVTLTAEMAKL